MSSEREMVISIWHRVDQYIQELEHAHNSIGQPLPTAGNGDTQPPHIALGSWDSYRNIGGYEEEFGFLDFAEELATFLQRFKFSVHGKDFNLSGPLSP